jgi:Rod binding domain-containing protein
MDVSRINRMTNGPQVDPERARAEKTAMQFEQIFVRSMVQTLRSSASIGGEGGGMFGDGPGADTFADWFDQNLSERISSTSKIGIKDKLLADLERHGQIPQDLDLKAQAARKAAESASLRATDAKGGCNVVL